MINRRLLVTSAGVLIVCLLGIIYVSTRNKGEPVINFPPRVIDFESYDSVEPVVDSSDTIVVGTVGPVVDRQVDDGGFPDDPENGNPVVLQEILIKEVLRNDSLKVGDKIVVASLDNSRIKVDGQRPLVEGEEIVFLAVQLPKSRTPGIRRYSPLYAESSVFDLNSDGFLQPRDSNIKALRSADAAKGISSMISLGDLRGFVRNKPAKGLVWGPIKE